LIVLIQFIVAASFSFVFACYASHYGGVLTHQI